VISSEPLALSLEDLGKEKVLFVNLEEEKTIVKLGVWIKDY